MNHLYYGDNLDVLRRTFVAAVFRAFRVPRFLREDRRFVFRRIAAQLKLAATKAELART